MVSRLSLVLALTWSLTTFAHPVAHHANAPHEIRVIGTQQSSVLNLKRQEAPAASVFQALVTGNEEFRKEDPELLKTLTEEGQAPPFLMVTCSDSRVNENTIFKTKPGTFFTQRNIANQILPTDHNTESVVAYGVTVLGVKHIILMGHYGCGGVAAAIASAPPSGIDAASGVVQNWIEPIRQIFQSSTRPEIVEFREKTKGNTTIEEPEVDEPAFRALVEENVKSGVDRLAKSNVIKNHFARLAEAAGASTTPEAVAPHARRASHHAAELTDVFIHGWVYDIANGEVKDMGISVGPPGKEIPAAPFPVLAGAVEQAAAAHQAESVQVRCEGQCKSKRSFFSRRR